MKTLKQSTLALMVAACFGAAVAAPTLPQVVSGQATFAQQGNVFSITNTPNTIINWQSFSVNPGEITRFIQQDANSAVLNRILGQDPSKILGALQSNGRVFLINPNGILFGRDARVDVNGLVASTLDLSNADFLAGKKNFKAGPVAGNLSNQGTIATPNGGQVFLIAPNVENSGVITSPKGEVVLAAGHTVQLVDSANPDLHVVVSAPANQAINLGQVIAQGGKVGIYGALVNQRGTANANSAVVGENGKIVLKASGDTLLEAGSVTSATGAGKGGEIQVLGKRVALTGDAQVDASGAAGGGTVLVGGDYQGANAAIRNAQEVFIDRAATIRADAQQAGDGGKVIAWADGLTRAYGKISARGGAQGGDGGFVETSGHVLDMQGSADTRAPKGKTGTLLLDPTNIYIAGLLGTAQAAGMPGADISASTSPFVGVGTITDSLLTVAALEGALSSSSVTVSTVNAGGAGTGNIKVVDGVTWGTANQLTLYADGSIALNGSINATSGGGVSLRAIAGNITQTQPITASSLLAIADTGTVALGNAANAVGTVAGYSGPSGSGFSFSSSIPLAIGVVSGSHGVISFNGPLSVAATGGLSVTDTTYGAQSSNDALTLSALSTGTLNVAGPVTTGGGAATLTGAAGVSLTGTGSVTTAGGALDILATNPGGLFSMAANTQISTGGGSVGLVADKMDLGGTAAGGAINSGSGGVVLIATTPSTNIKVGATAGVDGIGLLALTDTELASITTSNSLIVKAFGGATLDVAGVLNLAGPGHLTGGLSLMTATGNLTVNPASPLTVPSSLFMYTDGTLETNSAISAGTTILLEANKMKLVSGALTSPMSVQLVAPGAAIDMGSTTDAGAALELSGAELNLVAAPSLTITSNTGAINVTGSSIIAPAGVTSSINLQSADTITVGSSTGITSAAGLHLSAYSGANPMITNGGALHGTNIDLTSPKMALGGGSIVGSLSVDLIGGATTPIWLGAVGDSSAGTLELSSAELNTVASPVLRIKSPASGDIVVKTALAGGSGGAFEHLTGTSTLVLQTPTGDVSQLGGATIGGVSQMMLYGHFVNMPESNPTGVVAGYGAIGFNFHSANQIAIQYLDGVHGISVGSERTIKLKSDNFGISQASGNRVYAPDGNLVLEAAGPANLPEPNNSFRFVAAKLNTGPALGRGESVLYTASDMNVSSGLLGMDGTTNISGINTNNQDLELATGTSNFVLTVTNVVAGTGTVDLETDDLNLVGTVEAGAVLIHPHSAGLPITIGSLTCHETTLAGDCLRVNGLGNILAPQVGIGKRYSEPGGPGNIYVEAISVGGPPVTARNAMTTVIGLGTPGTITQGGAIDVPELGISAGGAVTLNSGNKIGRLAAETNGAPLSFANVDGFSVGTLSAGHLVDGGTSTLGGVTTLGGSINLKVDAGALTLSAPVASTGAVTLTAGAANSPLTTNVVAFDAGVVATGGLTVNANRMSGAHIPAAGPGVTLNALGATVPPPPPPSIGACIANPGLSGCGAVLPSLEQCIASPTAPGCTVILPPVAACVTAPTTPGCGAVLPPLAACIAAPTTVGCSVVLPSLPSCIANPAAPGCSVVLPPLASCIATPSAAGCTVVLPSLPVCTAAPTTAGCVAVLPSLPTCIASPTAAGCSAILPPLTACVATPTITGCSVVLPSLPSCIAAPTVLGCSVVLPSLPACISNPTGAGCSVVLPSLAACVAAPSTAGCSAVLPTLPQCTVNPAAAGCSAVLPKLSTCILAPTTAGCLAVLPTLAQCTASPTLQGCTVVLPPVATCAINPSAAGCTAVLPTASFCDTHPVDATCTAVKPPADSSGTTPIGQAVNSTVNIINTTTTTVLVRSSSTASGSNSNSGTGSGGGSAPPDSKKDETKKDDKQEASSQDKSGAKNNEPTKKMYCN